ncbi:MarR family transcriptional regulator [Stackebrandtia endophytica]|uniref:MarR family transcriptional regulator n=1 Tax=Stackebrandtia endophytica TaxID=1496996 RepID=A0A543AYN0_9ACTN|nr:MarR family transcriptional regulator [Stackebrandtia endophytica]TQL77630.1 MarR family transcriptional regulator [Stackebrandtia endophytica]
MTGFDRGADGVPQHGGNEIPALAPRQLEAYFALQEGASLLQQQIEQHLRTEGDLSLVQFHILMRLRNGTPTTMTELADGIVHSRSGLTYQAGLLEKSGLITRAPSPDDERATLVTLTDKGRTTIATVLPGHVQVVRRLLFDLLPDEDLDDLGRIMGRVRDHIRAEPPRSRGSRAT